MKISSQKKAFSLIELSIVIVIIAILLSGVLSASVVGVNNAKVKVTNDRIKEIYNALGNFLVVNGRLPCPASITNSKTADSTYGMEEGTAGTCATSGETYSSTTSTNLIYGMIPFKTLGLPIDMGEDGFETKLAYIVDKRFTSSTNFDSTTATGIITVQEKPSSTSQTSTADAIFAIISYGINKSGGYGINSSSQNTRSSDSDELENDITSQSGSEAAFTSTLVASSGNSDSFDDIVFYKTRNQIMQDFSAFLSTNCATANETLYGTTITWPEGTYNQEVVASTACPAAYDSGPAYPVKRCGAFGTWGSVIKPCLAP